MLEVAAAVEAVHKFVGFDGFAKEDQSEKLSASEAAANDNSRSPSAAVRTRITTRGITTAATTTTATKATRIIFSLSAQLSRFLTHSQSVSRKRTPRRQVNDPQCVPPLALVLIFEHLANVPEETVNVRRKWERGEN